MYKNSLPLSLLILASVITSSINAMQKDESVVDNQPSVSYQEELSPWFEADSADILSCLKKVDRSTCMHLKNNVGKSALEVDIVSKINDPERLLNILHYYHDHKYPYAVQNKNINDKTLSVVYVPTGCNIPGKEVKVTYSIIKRARL